MHYARDVYLTHNNMMLMQHCPVKIMTAEHNYMKTKYLNGYVGKKMQVVGLV